MSTRVALFLFTLSLLPESANLIHLKALVLHRFLLFSKCGLFPITPHLIAQAGEGGSAPAALIKMLMHLRGNISLAEQKEGGGGKKKCVIKHLPFSFCKCSSVKMQDFQMFQGRLLACLSFQCSCSRWGLEGRWGQMSRACRSKILRKEL